MNENTTFKMKKKLLFYLVVIILVILDSVLITSPNLLGKIGLFIYKYYYLRTFPRTLLTVSLVIFTAVAISEIIHFLVRQQIIKRTTGFILLLFLLLLSLGVLVKTNMDFSAWTYGHTGTRFKYGAYLLSVLLITVFGFGLITLPRLSQPWPASPAVDKSENVE